MGDKVAGLLHNRVQYAEAIKYYIDLTPAEELDRLKYEAASFHTGKRLSKVGRPTKTKTRSRRLYRTIKLQDGKYGSGTGNSHRF